MGTRLNASMSKWGRTKNRFSLENENVEPVETPPTPDEALQDEEAIDAGLDQTEAEQARGEIDDMVDGVHVLDTDIEALENQAEVVKAWQDEGSEPSEEAVRLLQETLSGCDANYKVDGEVAAPSLESYRTGTAFNYQVALEGIGQLIQNAISHLKQILEKIIVAIKVFFDKYLGKHKQLMRVIEVLKHSLKTNNPTGGVAITVNSPARLVLRDGDVNPKDVIEGLRRWNTTYTEAIKFGHLVDKTNAGILAGWRAADVEKMSNAVKEVSGFTFSRSFDVTGKAANGLNAIAEGFLLGRYFLNHPEPFNHDEVSKLAASSAGDSWDRVRFTAPALTTSKFLIAGRFDDVSGKAISASHSELTTILDEVTKMANNMHQLYAFAKSGDVVLAGLNGNEGRWERVSTDKTFEERLMVYMRKTLKTTVADIGSFYVNLYHEGYRVATAVNDYVLKSSVK